MKMELLRRFLSLGTRSDSSLEARRRGGLVNGLSTVGIVFLLTLGTAAAIRGVTVLSIVDFIAVLALIGLLAFFWSTGRNDIAAYFGVIFIGIFFLLLLMLGGEQQTAFVWYYSFPLIATFLLGANKGILASLLLLGLGILYFTIDPLVDGWADYSLAFEIRFITSYSVVTLFSFLYEKMRSDADKSLEIQAQELQAAVIDLTKTQESLSAANTRLREEIQQRMEAVAEMQTATSEAHRANQAKSQFLANMSHELRTPLNHVIGFSEIVLNEKVGILNDIQHEYIGDVVSSSRHLLSIINDILDLARVESGKAEMEFRNVDLQLLLRDALKIVEDQAEKKSIQLEIETHNLPLNVVIDERMIRQVIYNLLQNAVKFTNDGGTVKLSGGVSELSNETIFIQISDTGIGLDSGHLEGIFGDFEQVNGEHQIAQEGTGLGLSLSRRFVEMHGGSIWATSDGLGTGSTFTFRIPTRPKEIA